MWSRSIESKGACWDPSRSLAGLENLLYFFMVSCVRTLFSVYSSIGVDKYLRSKFFVFLYVLCVAINLVTVYPYGDGTIHTSSWKLLCLGRESWADTVYIKVYDVIVDVYPVQIVYTL